MNVAIISNEKTVSGFKMAGVANNNLQNVFIFSEDADLDELSKVFRNLIKRSDVAIILISQSFAELIRDDINSFKGISPSICIIPTRV